MLLRVILEVACAVAVVYGAYCVVYNLANGLYRRCERRYKRTETENPDSVSRDNDIDGDGKTLGDE